MALVGPGDYRAIFQAHLRQLDRLIQQRGLQGLRRIYDAAQADVEAELRALVRAARADTYDAYVHRLVLGQLQQAQVELAGRLANEAGDVTREAQIAAVRTLATDLARLEKVYGGVQTIVPIAESARLMGLIDRQRSSLLRMHAKSFARYGADNVQEMEQQLAVSLATKETPLQAIDRVQAVASNNWWQAERIVRTETAWAYSSSHAEAIQEVQRQVPDMRKRWSEYVSDDGRPLDDRVGADSIALHGQVAIDGMFTMPDNADEVSDTLRGQQWAHPPNRPNDRAVLMPWRPTWGIPAWEYRDGRKVWLVRP